MDDDDPVMVAITRQPNERLAKEAARKLLRAGVGSTIEPVSPAAPVEAATDATAGSSAADGVVPADPVPADTGPPDAAPPDAAPGDDPVATESGDWPAQPYAVPPVVPPGPEEPVGAADGDGAAPAGFEVRVLDGDVSWACQVLGVDEPESASAPEEEPAKAPWKSVLLLFAVALVVIPLVAFVLSYYLVTNDLPSP